MNANDLSVSFKDVATGRVYAQILMFGFDEPESIRGQHVHGIVIDEAQECPNEVFQEIILPTTTQNDATINVIGTPKGPDEDKLFYTLWKQGQEEKSLWKVLNRTIKDTGEYPANWEMVLATTEERRIQQEYYCSFDAAVNNRIYHTFDNETHIKPLRRRDGATIYVGMDFNVSMMPAVIGQKHEHTLEIFDEIVRHNVTTQQLAEEIKAKYGTHNVVICPDASGAHRTTQTYNTNHSILQQAGFKILSPKKNPLVKHRLMSVNVLFKDASNPPRHRLFIDPKCENLINTLRFHTYTDGTREIPDKKGGYDHCGDALGYLVWQTFPIQLQSGLRRSRFKLAA
ncbi:MAG: hypothetical protein ABS78_19460 [Phenylobacterium sp. SCN 70-31]|nr:MAG: hypothetical protein ABS78_19460 [Phenylobacterium sp. SCN 70-31]